MSELIIDIFNNNYGPEVIIHPTTVAFIETIVQPYDHDLVLYNDYEHIRLWIIETFPTNIKDEIINLVLGTANMSIEQIKNSLLYFLIHHILVEGMDNNPSDNSRIYPWDIYDGLYIHDAQEALFFTNSITGMLPVDVIVHELPFTHLMSFNMAMGILLFSHTIGIDFHMTMFGVPLTYFEYGPERFTQKDDEGYQITVNNLVYQFDDLDFIRGFSTGALWCNVDHHAYWSHFEHNGEQGDF